MIARTLGFYRDLLRLNLGCRMPFRVTLMVSEECPLRCATCGIWRRAEPRRPSLEDLERFFRANPGLSWINLTGGEIFMRDDVAAMFRMIASSARGLSVLNFPTAGQHPERILSAVEAGLAAGLRKMVVTVSFDGGASVHDRLRGKRGAFENAARTFAGLRDLAGRSGRRLQAHPGLTLSGELLRLTPDPLDDLVRDLGLNGIAEIHVNLAHRSDHYYANAELAPLPRKRILKTLNRALRARQANGRQDIDGRLNLLERIYLGYGREYIRAGKSPVACKALAASVFIDTGLDVFPCTVFPRRLGNLKEHGFDLSAMRDGPEWRAARSLVESSACPGCWTPCEAYPAILGRLLGPQGLKILGLAIAGGAP